MNKKIFIIPCILLGLALWIIGGPQEVERNAWHVLSVFLAVILSFVLRPYPIGMSVIIGLIILVVSNTITMTQALTGFGDSTVWLVIAAFLLAGAILNTGLGIRIALNLVVKLGRSIRGLAYAICGSEIVLATVVPSNTARGGGIHAPIVDSLSRSLESTPKKNPDRAGSFLSLVGGHANLIAASMFMTGMAANPLVSKAAKDVFNIDFTWGTWALGAIVPGLLSMAILPQLIYALSRPNITDVSKARKDALQRLDQLGPMSRPEKVMSGVLLLMLLLWSTQFLHGLSTTIVAWVGIGVLLVSEAQSWDQIIKNHRAWDALVWLGGLLTMANLLLEFGFIDWFVQSASLYVDHLPGLGLTLVLALIYFYSMYAFSMLTAHIAAMAVPFFVVCLSAGSPPLVTIALFAYFSCLCGCTTNYSSGPVIIYFGLGYVRAPKWFKIGFVVSLFHIVTWTVIGLIWWKIIGWW